MNKLHQIPFVFNQIKMELKIIADTPYLVELNLATDIFFIETKSWITSCMDYYILLPPLLIDLT